MILAVSPTVPTSPDYTPASPDYSPISDTEFDPSEDPSSDHIPPIPATLPFLSSAIFFRPVIYLTHQPITYPWYTFTENTLARPRDYLYIWCPSTSSHGSCTWTTIPHGRTVNRDHFNGSVYMMTARKRVGPLPTHRLAIRHSIDYSSSNHFSLDDSLRGSSLSLSSEAFSDSSANALSDSASSRSSFDHSLPTPSSGMRPSHHLCSLEPSIHRSSAAISDRPSHDSSSASPSRKRSRSPAAPVPLSSPTLGALSYARADLLPSPKRIRSPELAIDLEGCSEDSFDPYAEIDKCIAYANALRDRGINARVVVEAIDREEIETDMRGPVEVRVDRVTHPVVADDIPEPAQEGAVEVTYETLGDLVQRFHDHTEEILVHRVQVIESVQRIMPNTRSGASRTRERINEQIDRQMAGALESGDCWLRLWTMASFDDTKNWDGEHTNSPMISNYKLKIGDEFLKILQENAFNGMNRGDVTNHIAKVQAKFVLLKELMAACLASTMNSSTKKIADGM
ncbi:hypothetical protein Tco_1263979 [Tanacetum coccineum]